MTLPFPGVLEACREKESIFYARLSSLGVRVLDSEEVERNVLDQAATLSAKESPEFKKRFTHQFCVILQLHLFVPILFRKQQFKILSWVISMNILDFILN